MHSLGRLDCGPTNQMHTLRRIARIEYSCIRLGSTTTRSQVDDESRTWQPEARPNSTSWRVAGSECMHCQPLGCSHVPSSCIAPRRLYIGRTSRLLSRSTHRCYLGKGSVVSGHVRFLSCASSLPRVGGWFGGGGGEGYCIRQPPTSANTTAQGFSIPPVRRRPGDNRPATTRSTVSCAPTNSEHALRSTAPNPR